MYIYMIQRTRVLPSTWASINVSSFAPLSLTRLCSLSGKLSFYLLIYLYTSLFLLICLLSRYFCLPRAHTRGRLPPSKPRCVLLTLGLCLALSLSPFLALGFALGESLCFYPRYFWAGIFSLLSSSLSLTFCSGSALGAQDACSHRLALYASCGSARKKRHGWEEERRERKRERGGERVSATGLFAIARESHC